VWQQQSHSYQSCVAAAVTFLSIMCGSSSHILINLVWQQQSHSYFRFSKLEETLQF